jgi:hypothetical protein
MDKLKTEKSLLEIIVLTLLKNNMTVNIILIFIKKKYGGRMCPYRTWMPLLPAKLNIGITLELLKEYELIRN